MLPPLESCQALRLLTMSMRAWIFQQMALYLRVQIPSLLSCPRYSQHLHLLQVFPSMLHTYHVWPVPLLRFRCIKLSIQFPCGLSHSMHVQLHIHTHTWGCALLSRRHLYHLHTWLNAVLVLGQMTKPPHSLSSPCPFHAVIIPSQQTCTLSTASFF